MIADNDYNDYIACVNKFMEDWFSPFQLNPSDTPIYDETFDFAFGKKGELMQNALLQKDWHEVEVMICKALKEGYLYIIRELDGIVISDPAENKKPITKSEIDEVISMAWSDLPKLGYDRFLGVGDPYQWDLDDGNIIESIRRNVQYDLAWVTQRLREISK